MTTATPPQKTIWKFPFYYGWVIVAVVAIANFTESAEIFPVLGVLLKPVTEEFGWSRSAFTLATSIGTLAGGLAGPIVGPLVDRHGAKWILLISFTLLGATMIAWAFITELWQFYVIQILARFLALGVISLALQIMIPKWFVAKRARAVAYSGLGGRFGNAITPLYVQAIVTAAGWRAATMTTGIVMLAFTLLPVALFVKRQPEDIGLLPDGMTPEQAAKAREDVAKGRVRREISFTLKQVARMPAFYLLIAANAISAIVGGALNLHMVPYFTDVGLSPSVAVLVTTVLFGASAVGSVVFGFLAERFGIRVVVAIDYVLMGFAFLLLLQAKSPGLAFFWAVIQGVTQGGGLTLQQVLFADYFGRGSLGAIRGATTPVQLGTNAIGPLAAAMAFDAFGNYVAIFLAFGLCRVVSGLLIFAAKPPPGSAADNARKPKETATPT
jgi:MFS family permease